MSKAKAPTESHYLEELIATAAGGDKQAQEQLLARYWFIIRQAVRARKNRLGQGLAAREETQDLQQAAAMRVLSQLPQHQWQGRSRFAAWVKKLSSLEVIDVLRHHRAQKRDVMAEKHDAEAVDNAPSKRFAETHFDDRQKLQRLVNDVESLKPEYGAALLMHHMGFSHAEIGESLDCSAEAARKLVSRARLRLVDKQRQDAAKKA